MKRALLCVACVLTVGSGAFAKNLSSRLGVGYRNAYSFDLPSIAAHYSPNSEYQLIGALGIDTEDQNAKFALSGGIRKMVFTEENLNFFMGGVLSMISREVAGSTDSGFELGALVGTEFFLAGLDNLGFSVETGIAVTNVKKVRFRTMGDSFIRSGIVFYF